jgi:CHAT domain-containing protein
MDMQKKPLLCVFALAACGFAAAQAQVKAPGPASPGNPAPAATASSGQTPAPTTISSADRAFAQTLAALPLDQAKAAIAQAEPGRRTAGAANALRELGNAILLDNKQPPEDSLNFYLKALEVAGYVNDPLLTAGLLLNEGNSYRISGNNEASLDAYDRSVAIYAKHPGSPKDLGRIYGARAVVRKDLGDFDGSLDDGHIALENYRKIGDEVGMARSLNNLGNTEHAMGNATEARNLFEEGLRLARAQHQRLGEAYLLNNIADTYLQQDNAALAIDYCLQAIKIKEELGSKDDLITSLANLVRVYDQSHNSAEAQKTIERAWTIAQNSGRANLTELVLAEWGSLAKDEKHYDLALEKLQQALIVGQKTTDRPLENETLEQIAEVELNLQRYADAARDAQTVLTFAQQIGFRENAVTSAYTLGEAELHLGHPEKARAEFETSVAIVEEMREHVAGGDQALAEFFAHRTDVYQALAALDASEGRWEDALRLSEREKGRTLLDMLTQGRVTLSSQLTTAEKSEEKQLRMQLAALEAQRTKAALAQPVDTTRLQALDQRMNKAVVAVSSFREHMYSVHPELSRHRGDAQLITLTQTAQLLPNASTAILEYEVTPSATYLFVITAGQGGPMLRGYTIPVTSAILRARVEHLHQALMARDPGFAQPAEALYRLLIAPARVQLAGKHEIILVPSGDLWRLPFQALRTPSGKYLLETASILYAPSLSVLRAYAAHHATPETGHALLALGDPQSDLPEAAREVHTLAALYGRSSTRAFTGSTASKDNFRTYAATYDVIHLATHGVFDDHNPMYSHLVLAAGAPSANATMAQLDASEIADMNMKATLVVLSACETGEGKFEAGEGLIGLSWSFLAAGSQAAVASQWRVESASTTDLMIAFHRGLQTHMGKAAALRQAELTVAHNPRYQHPFYWAGFVMVGGD